MTQRPYEPDRWSMAVDIYGHTLKGLDGAEIGLESFRSQVLLIVNTASRCMFTKQYEGLERLHRELSPRGFSVLAFPCNQFGGQEPGSHEAIAEFCATTYQVSFPIFQKVDVNGPSAHPIFVELKARAPGLMGMSGIKWNFTKFLVGRGGKSVERFAPTTRPEELEDEIRQLL